MFISRTNVYGVSVKGSLYRVIQSH